MSKSVIKPKKNHDIKDSFVKKCRVVECSFYAPFDLLKSLFTGVTDVTPDTACYVGDAPNTPIVYSKPIGYLTEEGKSFSLRIPSKGYIVGKVIEDGNKKQAMIKGIYITGKRSLVAFRQLWQLLQSSYGKLDMYLIWQDGGCYSLRLNDKVSTCDILSEYPKELID